jgi:hypothetical protein
VALNGSGTLPTSIAAVDSLSVIVTEPLDQQGVFGVIDALPVQASESSTVNTGSLTAVFSVSDSLAMQATETSTLTATTVLLVADSCQLQSPEDVPDVATVIAATESVLVGAMDTPSQTVFLSVSDALLCGASEGSGAVMGFLTFLTADSLASTASEVTSFGLTAVGTAESLAVQVSEVLANSATVSAVDAMAAQVAESSTMVKALFTTEAFAVQFIDAGQPIFNSFLNLNAVDACAVQAAESVTQLASFLTQIATTDSLAVQALDGSSSQSVMLGAVESFGVAIDDAPAISVTRSTTESLAVQFAEAGLAIPILTVSVSAFAGDIVVVGLSDQATVAIVYDAITRSVSDALVVQASEQSQIRPGYYTNEVCAVGASEVCTQRRVANRTHDKWDGSANVEHKRDQPSPGRYCIPEAKNW